jgi:hypothetical protein
LENFLRGDAAGEISGVYPVDEDVEGFAGFVGELDCFGGRFFSSAVQGCVEEVGAVAEELLMESVGCKL